MKQQMNRLRSSLRETGPLIHCITNPISINLCANGILAVGGRPIMAEHPAEVAEITETASALLLNLANITDVRMESMKISAEKAAEKEIPIVLDLVGIGCSGLRRKYALSLLEGVKTEAEAAAGCKDGRRPFAVLKGNYSEILALHRADYRSSGVDGDTGLGEAAIAQVVKKLAARYGCTVLASGKTDLLSDENRTFAIKNGTAQLASVTGTGCLLGALTAAYLGAEEAREAWNEREEKKEAPAKLANRPAPGLLAALTACTVLGICGELAETEKGSGTFLSGLLDHLSVLPRDVFETRIRMEELL